MFYYKTTWEYGRHIHKHFPDDSFCPICMMVLSRHDSLQRHLMNQAHRSASRESKIAHRFGIGAHTEQTSIINKKHYFNLYWLGAMDDYAVSVGMDEEQFRIMANRRWEDPICPPFMTEGDLAGNRILQGMFRADADEKADDRFKCGLAPSNTPFGSLDLLATAVLSHFDERKLEQGLERVTGSN